MKIFFYSTVFAPSVGGIETLVETLCREFVMLGHEVEVATETPGDGTYTFSLSRQPKRARIRQLLKWCDVHVQANVSLKAAWVWPFAFRKTIYQHNNVYQRDDGTHHFLDQVKTCIALAAPGIANSTYTASKTGAKNVIQNAYDNSVFGPAPDWQNKIRDLVFLGRLVSQKGCDTLIEALAILHQRGLRPDLTVIGSGPDRAELERLTEMEGLKKQVRFLGGLKGQKLAAELSRHRVMVVPSRYEEPFGIVALEGLACGCIPIVSGRGGLTDAIAGHGFTFPNGDSSALGNLLEGVLSDMDRARAKLNGVDSHLARCSSRAVAERYIEMFEHHLGGPR